MNQARDLHQPAAARRRSRAGTLHAEVLVWRLALAIALVLAVACRASTPAASPGTGAPWLAGKRILVLGDSITQDGRWVSFLEYELVSAFPDLDFDIVSIGLASETCSGLSEPGHAGGAFPRPCLFERLGRALDEVRPAIVIACYGMNDGIYLPLDEARFAAFRTGVTRLAADVAASGAELVLVTPPVFDPASHRPACDSPYERALQAYADWEMHAETLTAGRRVELHGAMLTDLYARRSHDPGFAFTNDGVHPSDLGHMVIARVVLQGLGVEPRVPSADDALAAARLDPLFALVDERRRLRSEAWLAHVGYTRETLVPPITGDLPAAETRLRDLSRRVDDLRRH